MKANQFFKTSPMFDSIEIVRELPRCPKCGTNGDHYCPASVDTGETDPEEEQA